MLRINVPGTPAVRGDDCWGGWRLLTGRKQLARSHCAVSGRLPSFTPSFISLPPTFHLPAFQNFKINFFSVNEIFFKSKPSWMRLCRKVFFSSSPFFSTTSKQREASTTSELFFFSLPPLALLSDHAQRDVPRAAHRGRISLNIKVIHHRPKTFFFFFFVVVIFVFFVCHLLPADRSGLLRMCEGIHD